MLGHPPARSAQDIDAYFRLAIQHDASNVHLKAGKPAYLRVNGRLLALGSKELSEEDVVRLCAPLLSERHTEAYYRDGGTDFAYVLREGDQAWRFRLNIFQQLGSMAMVAQVVEPHVPPLDDLHLPCQLKHLCTLDQGMILVAGMTGTGKTTTIASMLDHINHTCRKHILTIEDPIEYIFEDDQCLINQREIGESVRDFATAMKHAVREDPDVIMVGEMRDAESFSTALHAAETGHLVFGTVHAAAAATTIGRILDLFPQEMHPALRSSICFNMRAILAQKLLTTIVEDPRRVPIIEIMTFNPTVRKLVLEGEDVKLPDAIELGRVEGMQTFDDSLYEFVMQGMIGRADAIAASHNPNAFKMRLKGIDVKTSGLL